MSKNTKSTPFLMILVLSIIATQLFLNAFGINMTPRIGTIFQSWGKVASVIGCMYHPSLVAELNTLSTHFLYSDGKVPSETEKNRGELACNRGREFEFEAPPPIDVNDPSVTIKEPVKECFLKAISRSIVRKDSIGMKELDVEVLEIAADSDEESAAPEAKPVSKEESIRSIAVGVAADEPGAESKAFAPQSEVKVFFDEDEAPVAPKTEKLKKPCPDLEKLRKLDETVKLLDGYKFEQELQLVNQAKSNLEIQAFQAFKYLERSKRVRVMIRRNPTARPHPAIHESFNVLTVAEESEF